MLIVFGEEASINYYWATKGNLGPRSLGVLSQVHTVV